MFEHRNMKLVLFTSAVFLALCGFVVLSPATTLAQTSDRTTGDLAGVKIYFSEAFAEASQFNRSDSGISRFAAMLRYAGAQLATFDWRTGIPADADLIIIPGPSSDIAVDAIARLWMYLNDGGNVLISADAFDGRGQVSRALPEAASLSQLLWQIYGLRFRNGVIVEEGERTFVEVEERDDQNNVTFTFSGELPTLSLVLYSGRVNADHPITASLHASIGTDDSESQNPNLRNLYVNGARSIQISPGFDSALVAPLILTEGDNVYGETDFARYLNSGYAEYTPDTDTERSDLILGAAAEDRDAGSRIVLLGDTDLFRNGTGFAVSPAYSASFVNPVNVQFMLNTVSWLVERDAPPLSLATPAPTATATFTPSPTPAMTPTPAS